MNIKKYGCKSLVIAAACSFMLSGQDAAAQAENDFEIGAFAGWHWFNDDNEIGRD